MFGPLNLCHKSRRLQGCPKGFSSVMDRRKHLTAQHAFPTNYALDCMHLAKRQGQQRPEAGFQKGAGRGKGRVSREATVAAEVPPPPAPPAHPPTR